MLPEMYLDLTDSTKNFFSNFIQKLDLDLHIFTHMFFKRGLPYPNPRLISLDLSKCRLDSLTHLPRLQLRHLRLEENQLRSTLGIAGCPRLLEAVVRSADQP
jgi:hypothetical protein